MQLHSFLLTTAGGNPNVMVELNERVRHVSLRASNEFFQKTNGMEATMIVEGMFVSFLLPHSHLVDCQTRKPSDQGIGHEMC